MNGHGPETILCTSSSSQRYPTTSFSAFQQAPTQQVSLLIFCTHKVSPIQATCYVRRELIDFNALTILSDLSLRELGCNGHVVLMERQMRRSTF
jgi:hypothetical protein